MMRYMGLFLIVAMACVGCKPPASDVNSTGSSNTNKTIAPAVSNQTTPAPTETEMPTLTPTPVEEPVPEPTPEPEMKKEEPAAPMETPAKEPAPSVENPAEKPAPPMEEMKQETPAEDVDPEAAAQPTPAEDVEGLLEETPAKKSETKEAAPKEKPAPMKEAPKEEAAESPAPEEEAAMKKPEAEAVAAVKEAVAETVAVEAAGPVELALTPENTLIQFVGTHVGEKPDPRTGKFNTFTGSAKAVDGKLTAVSVAIDTPSLETEIEKLTNHLKSPDFFDVRQHPEATFTSTKIKPAKDGTVKITGDLTMLGKTKSITFPAKVTVDKDVKLDAEFVIDRVDFGMDYSPDKVHKEVTMTIKVGK